MAGGDFNTYNGIACHNLIRLNNDGTMDNSFTVPGKPTKEYSGYGIFTLVIQKDGKILAGGKFDYYNTKLQQSIVRLNTDGSIDNTFGGETGFDTEGRGGALVSAITLTIEGNIVAGGSYKRYDAELRSNIAEMDKNGKLLQNLFHAMMNFNKTDNLFVLQTTK